MHFIWLKAIANFEIKNFKNSAFVEYRICRVLFGLSSSLSLLTATLQKHFNQYNAIDPEFVENVLQSIYVHDCIFGTQNTEETKVLVEKSKTCLAKGGCSLHKFKSISIESEEHTFSKF